MHECESEHTRKIGAAKHTQMHVWFLDIRFTMIKASPNNITAAVFDKPRATPA